MTINIQPTEIAGEHWINIKMDGCEMNRHGPFDTADEAEVAAARIAAVCRVLHADVHLPAAAACRR